MIVIMISGDEISFQTLTLRSWIPLPHSLLHQHYCFNSISCSVRYSPDLNYWRPRSSELGPSVHATDHWGLVLEDQAVALTDVLPSSS